MSMLATGEGPTQTPVTLRDKVFASFIAFVGVSSVVFALAFLIRLILLEERKLRKDEKMLVRDIGKYRKLL